MDPAKKWWIGSAVAGCCSLLCFAAAAVIGLTLWSSRGKGIDGVAPAGEAVVDSSAPLRVGDRVDFAGREARATVVEVEASGKLRIHLDGCPAYLAESEVRPDEVVRAGSIGRDAADVTFLVGKWALFEPGTFNTTTRGDEVVSVWGMGAKAPPLLINEDGTYEWQEDSSRLTRGHWRTDAKVRGVPPKASRALEKSSDHDGVVIKDSEGNEWKLYKVIIDGKDKDSVGLARICQEANYFMGTRIR
jgi:hypothetical protein